MEFLRYLVMRLAIFGLTLAVVGFLWTSFADSRSGVGILLVSFVISGLISMPMLRKQRAALAARSMQAAKTAEEDAAA